MKLSNIDFSKIKLPEVVDVIKNQMAHGVVRFTDLKTTAPTSENINTFNQVEDRFVIPYSIQKVFDHYVSMNPANVWKRRELIGYEFCVDKNTGEVFYHDDNYPGGKEGQVLYIPLNILGVKRICVAQEIIRIDPENYNITFSYIEGGMTKGTQSMQFNKISETETELVHFSYFKGVSAFRDKFYPFFHTMIVKKMHESVLDSINGNIIP